MSGKGLNIRTITVVYYLKAFLQTFNIAAFS